MDSVEQDYAYLSMVGGSHVDETLFGNKSKKRGKNREEVLITGRDTVIVRKSANRSQKAAAATYMTASELNKIRESAVLT